MLGVVYYQDQADAGDGPEPPDRGCCSARGFAISHRPDVSDEREGGEEEDVDGDGGGGAERGEFLVNDVAECAGKECVGVIKRDMGSWSAMVAGGALSQEDM